MEMSVLMNLKNSLSAGLNGLYLLLFYDFMETEILTIFHCWTRIRREATVEDTSLQAVIMRSGLMEKVLKKSWKLR